MMSVDINGIAILSIHDVDLSQPARNVVGTSPEGPIKVLTFRELLKDQQKIDNLMKKVFFKCNSPCFTHIYCFLLEKQIFKSFQWGHPLDIYGTQLWDVP